MKRPETKREDVRDDDPILLRDAARLSFPPGTMTARKLYKEYLAGRLVIERIGGQTFTTLGEIKCMRQRCRDQHKAPDSGHAPNASTPADASLIPPPGSSSTDDTRKAHDAALLILQELSDRSPATSRANTSTRPRKGNVLPLRSPSRT
jgi:hypothetical protein